ncbi:MAG: hypothetical protein WDW36_003760 [Sanguina aurantia]
MIGDVHHYGMGLTLSADPLPGPCYSLVFRRNSGRSFSTSSCILTHCGIQITPEGNSTSQECSEQAAAMCALLWLSGSLDPNGPSARVVPVGYPPLIRPDQLANFEPTPHTKESRQRDLLMKQLQDKRGQLAVEMAELERTHKALESGEMTHAAAALAVPEAAASPPGSRPPRPAKRARTAGSALGEVQASLSNLGPAPTGSVQELKELYDRHKWVQPQFNYTGGVADGFVCEITLIAAGLGASQGSAPTKKRAKEAAAVAALQALAHLRLHS